MQKVKIKFAYKTGFRRLWLVIAVIWLGVGLTRLWGQWDEFFQLCIIPVAALYLIGAAAVWIVEGFARPDRDQ